MNKELDVNYAGLPLIMVLIHSRLVVLLMIAVAPNLPGIDFARAAESKDDGYQISETTQPRKPS
jgi:hypothetical protein